MKKVLFGVGVLALGGIVYFGLTGKTTTTPGVEGTIGAAKRYQAEQITTDDVVLEDSSINDILQTELFHELVTNPDFRKLVMSDEFQLISRGPHFKSYIGNPEVQKGYAAIENEKVTHTGGMQVALGDGSVRKLLSESPELQRLVAKDGFGRFLGEAVVQGKLASADGARGFYMAKGVIQDADLAKLLARNVSYAKLVEDADFQKLVAEQGEALAKLGSNPELARILRNPEAAKLLTNAEFGKILAMSPEVSRTLLSPELARLVGKSESFRNAFITGEYGRFVSTPVFQKLVSQADVERRH